MDEERSYIASDMDMVLDMVKNEIAFLKTNWHMSGRPTIILPIRTRILGGTLSTTLLSLHSLLYSLFSLSRLVLSFSLSLVFLFSLSLVWYSLSFLSLSLGTLFPVPPFALSFGTPSPSLLVTISVLILSLWVY